MTGAFSLRMLRALGFGEPAPASSGCPRFDRLVETNYESQRHAMTVRVDRMFGWVMAVQYVLAVAFAIAFSPRAYAGGLWSVHPHVWQALIGAAVLAAYPIVLTVHRPGRPGTRFAVAIAEGLFSALLIHLTNGRIETHFHVFGALAFLAMYRDWRVLVLNSAIVAGGHVIHGLYLPATIYGVASGAEWRFVEHAAWVVFEDAFLLVAIRENLAEMRGHARRQAELEIAREEIGASADASHRQTTLLDSVLAGMTDCVVMVDAEGRFVHVNAAARRRLGDDLAEVPPEAWSARFGIVDDEDRLLAPESLPLARAARGESVTDRDLRILHPETRELSWLEVSAEPIPDASGAIVGAVAVFRDVTERRRASDAMALAKAEAERANRAKSEFLSRMSHELRTPMNAILGFGQLLRMDDLTEDQDESLEQILRSGAHLLSLINEVLDLSGIEAGKLSISRECVGVAEVVEEVLGMVRPLAAASEVTLLPFVAVGEEALAFVDRGRLLQAVLNLVSNAIKYNVRGGEVRLAIESEGERVRLAVRDTGIGIPTEKRDRLFNPFDRLDAEGTQVEGTGLGLSLTKSIIEAMGGRIELRPVEPGGAGSLFVLDLPAAERPVSERSVSERAVSGPTSAPTGSPVRTAAGLSHALDVVMIEDNPANVRLVERILAARPEVRLHVARAGLPGIDLAREVRPDLILLDLDLPDLGGIEVLRLVRGDRRVQTDTAGPPRIVIVSADATPDRAVRAAELGVWAYLTKPFEVDGLLGLIDDLTTDLTLDSLTPLPSEERHVA